MKNIGINGAGFFENLTDDALAHFIEMVPTNSTITLRLPGGSITRFTDPAAENAAGWGMTEQSVNRFFDIYGDHLQQDEDDADESRETWLAKVAAQPNYRYIDKLLWFIDTLNDLNINVNVIWVSNIINSSIESQFNAITYLVDQGVNILAVELGNEVYGKYKFDPALYIEQYLQLRELLLVAGYEVKFSLVSGNFSGRKEHTAWNVALANLDPTLYDFITIHYYITSEKAPEAFSYIPKTKITIDYTYETPKLAAAVNAFKTEVLDKSLFFDEINAAADWYHKPLLITEFNTKPAGAFGNMLINGIWCLKQLVDCPESVHTICLHNGIAPDIYGCISKVRTQDDVIDLDMVKRINFYSMYFALQCNDSNDVDKTTEAVYNITNDFRTHTIKTPPPGYEIIDTVYQFVVGDYLYSSCGYLGFMSNKQPKTYEINNLYENIYTSDVTNINIYPNSYGIVTTYLQKLPDTLPSKPKSNWVKAIIKWLRSKRSY